MPTIPANFHGGKFMTKYSLSQSDFQVRDNELICPSLPDLTESDLVDCVVTPEELADLALRLQALLDMKDRYVWAINRLSEIRTSPNPSSVNLQVILAITNAVKDQAQITEQLLRVLRSIMT